jgi:hypothetical protein
LTELHAAGRLDKHSHSPQTFTARLPGSAGYARLNFNTMTKQERIAEQLENALARFPELKETTSERCCVIQDSWLDGDLSLFTTNSGTEGLMRRIGEKKLEHYGYAWSHMQWIGVNTQNKGIIGFVYQAGFHETLPDKMQIQKSAKFSVLKSMNE